MAQKSSGLLLYVIQNTRIRLIFAMTFVTRKETNLRTEITESTRESRESWENGFGGPVKLHMKLSLHLNLSMEGTFISFVNYVNLSSALLFIIKIAWHWCQPSALFIVIVEVVQRFTTVV